MTDLSNSKDLLKSLVDRIERLEGEKKAIADDIKDVYAEAKSSGYDTPAMRALIKRRAEDAPKREAREAILETYMHALGMLADPDLGRAAIERATAA